MIENSSQIRGKNKDYKLVENSAVVEIPKNSE